MEEMNRDLSVLLLRVDASVADGDGSRPGSDGRVTGA